jgi:type I restriction enzyme S subunit
MEKKKKPAIRFKGFTDSWEQRKLGDMASSFEYGLNAAAKAYDGENKYIRITDIDDNTHKFLTDSLTSPDIDLTGADNYKLTEGDILFARTGASVGKSYIYRNSDGLVYYAGFLIRARINEEYDKEFVFQNTLTDRYNKYIAVTSQRSGQPGVNAQEYAEFEINVPKKEEQTKIGTYFRNLDHLITLHQRKYDKLQIIKKSMLEKMFPQSGSCFPEIRFKGFTDSWEQRKFSDVVEIGSGMDYKHLGEGDIPVYGTGGYMLSVDSALSEEKDAIGIGRKGTIDKPYILRAPFWTVDTLFYCIPKENHDLDFINCLFQTVDWKKKDESTGVPSLSKVIINNVEAVVPSFDEQKKIGEYFNSIDHLITLHQREVEKLQNIKKSMLETMFV